MTLLSRKADYALLILSYLNARSESGCAREIAEHYGLSKGFVANIMKELCNKGFLTSTRGAKGGYELMRPVEEISLAELLESLEDGFRVAQCNDTHGDSELCSLMPICPVRAPIAELHQRLGDVLRGVMLADLFPVNEMNGRLISPPVLAEVRS